MWEAEPQEELTTTGPGWANVGCRESPSLQALLQDSAGSFHLKSILLHEFQSFDRRILKSHLH